MPENAIKKMNVPAKIERANLLFVINSSISLIINAARVANTLFRCEKSTHRTPILFHRTRMPRNAKRPFFIAIFGLIAVAAATIFYWQYSAPVFEPYRSVSTVAGVHGEFGEPFGIAVKGSDIYVSDGLNGKMWLVRGDSITVFAEGLDTPSGIAVDSSGNLVIADAGTNQVIVSKGNDVWSGHFYGGRDKRHGFADGDAASALFNAPLAVAASADGRIFVADTYNDRIRVIENGQVSTLAGSTRGFSDGPGQTAKFDTPCGITIWNDKIIVADTGNRRIRVIEPDGRVSTLAGTGELDLKDGLLSSSAFVQPTAVAVDQAGAILVADGNAIRRIGGNVIPTVRTLSDENRGLRDGDLLRSRFNRPSSIALDGAGDMLIADSDNRLVRMIGTRRGTHEITRDETESLRDKPEEFRLLQPPRWPYDPPAAPRDIAGTLGELRGEIPDKDEPARFHNGLDIAGAYGETARFVRHEKVLQPVAVSGFGTLRESLRMPSIGYIHIRLGRDSASKPLGDARFQFLTDALGKLNGVRVPRGTKFRAGEPIGTLNPMNHVHLIAGRSGFEMNALDALVLPGITDTKPPVIENVRFVNADASEAVKDRSGRIELSGKTRIIMRAYDQMNGSAARRRLGIYRAGYQLLRAYNTPLGDVQWTLNFARMPAGGAVPFVYADGSRSGATGETIFNYIVSNRVEGDIYSEGYFDSARLDSGTYILRVIAADYFGNQTYLDTQIEVKKL
jgi:NHL repeat